MPDPLAQSVSATEAPALFNASPYLTRWMLYQKFRRGRSIEKVETDRMYWGKALQPLVLAKAAADLALEVVPNHGETYERHPHLPLGCTRDARVYDPSRGWGSLETKCVFDYGVWMREWGGGDRVPRHYEIQLQQQMLIGGRENDGAHMWGVIAAWVCGEMHYFERAPIPDFAEALAEAAAQFFVDVQRGNEPEPFGEAVELSLLAELFDPEPGVGLQRGDDWKLAEAVRMLPDFSKQKAFYEKAYDSTRALLIAKSREAGVAYDEVRLPGGISYQVKANKLGHLRVKVSIPDVLPDEIMEVAK
jgi:hypothetical protein